MMARLFQLPFFNTSPAAPLPQPVPEAPTSDRSLRDTVEALQSQLRGLRDGSRVGQLVNQIASLEAERDALSSLVSGLNARLAPAADLETELRRLREQVAALERLVAARSEPGLETREVQVHAREMAVDTHREEVEERERMVRARELQVGAREASLPSEPVVVRFVDLRRERRHADEASRVAEWKAAMRMADARRRAEVAMEKAQDLEAWVRHLGNTVDRLWLSNSAAVPAEESTAEEGS